MIWTSSSKQNEEESIVDRKHRNKNHRFFDGLVE
jgi:hypothetical protein